MRAKYSNIIFLWTFFSLQPLSCLLCSLSKKNEKENLVMKATVCHAINSFIHSLFHAGVHCKGSVVWFEAPGLSYIISAGTSSGLFLHILLLHCVLESCCPGCTRPMLLSFPSLPPWGRCWNGKHVTLILALSSCRAGQPARSLCLHHLHEISCNALASSLLAGMSKERGFHVLRVIFHKIDLQCQLYRSA